MQLSGIDANLFVVLRALLDTRSVTLVSRRLALSPSATSHALSRLRDALGDPLFVRAGRSLVPTARALAVEGALSGALDALGKLLEVPAPLDPSRLARAFRVETTDHVQFVLLRALDRVLRERGLERRIARTSSTFLDMAFLVAETDYVVSLPESLARPLVSRLRLSVLWMPLPMPSFTHSMVWHRRSTHDAAHEWFRGLVTRAMQEHRSSPRVASIAGPSFVE